MKIGVKSEHWLLRSGQAPIWDVLFADRSTGSYGINKLWRHPKSSNSGRLV